MWVGYKAFETQSLPQMDFYRLAREKGQGGISNQRKTLRLCKSVSRWQDKELGLQASGGKEGSPRLEPVGRVPGKGRVWKVTASMKRERKSTAKGCGVGLHVEVVL